MITESIRQRIALITCVGSAGLGALAIYRAWGSVPALTFDVATVWTIAANWLVRRHLRRSGFRASRGWRRASSSAALAALMNVGGCVLVLVGAVTLCLR